LIFFKIGNLRKLDQKGSKQNSESSWSLLTGSLWKILFINPPEAKGRLFETGKKMNEK